MLLGKTEARKTLRTSGFSVSFVADNKWGCCHIWKQAHIFPHFPFFAYVSVEALLAPFHLLFFSAPVLILFMLELSEELLFHPCSSPATFARYSAHWFDPFLSLEENQPTLLAPLPSRAVFYEIIPSTSLNLCCDPAAFSLVSTGPWTLPSHGHYRQGCSWPLHHWLACSKYEVQKSTVSFWLPVQLCWDVVLNAILDGFSHYNAPSANIRVWKPEISSSYLKDSICAVPCAKKTACLQVHTDLCSSCSSCCRQCCTALQRATQMCWFPRKCMRFFLICLGDVSAVWGKEETKYQVLVTSQVYFRFRKFYHHDTLLNTIRYIP